MKEPLSAFFKRISVFSFFVAAGSFLWNNSVPTHLYSHFIWYIFIFFNAMAITSHIFSMRALQKSGTYFVRFYMALIIGKMFFYLSIILIVIFLFRSEAINFILTFLSFYILYTAFEVVQLIRRNTIQGAKQE